MSTHVLASIAGAYLLAVATWVFYLAAMSLLPRRHDLHPVAKVHAYLIVGVGLALDFVLHVVVGSVLFLKPPQDWLLTGRLTRYINDVDEARWRRALAGWICARLLDAYDPDGCHCKRTTP